MSYRKKCLFVNTNVAVSVSRQSTFPVCVGGWVKGYVHNDTTRCWPQHPLEPKVPVTPQQSWAEQKLLEVYQITWRTSTGSTLFLSLGKCILFPCSHFGKPYTTPLFPLLLCLATCGTQPLQYPAVHQTKSGMRNILRLPANSYENMLRPNLKQFRHGQHSVAQWPMYSTAQHSTSSCP